MTITARNTTLTVGLAAAAALVAVGVPLAVATPSGAPTAAPPSDSQGYVDSTARCAKPDTAVIFGTTDTSRVAVCQTAAGAYQYRGVRVSDGARLITTATKTSDNTFVAKNESATYTVTSQALSVTVNGNTFRTEAWTDYHGPQSPAGSTTSGTPKTSTSATSTSATAAPSTSASPSTSGTAAPNTSSAPKTSAAPQSSAASSAAPLPPPLPAEVGGATSDG